MEEDVPQLRKCHFDLLYCCLTFNVSQHPKVKESLLLRKMRFGYVTGDVLLHCVVDAILGALGLPDIGQIFPDTDPKWKGAASSVFVKEAVSSLPFLYISGMGCSYHI